MKIDLVTIDILGSKWTIRSATDEEEPYFAKNNANGYSDVSVKEILVRDFAPDVDSVKDIEMEQRHVMRHEIIHAFLWESGLWTSSTKTNAWAVNEEMIDFFAIQHEKIHKAFKDAGALDADANVDKLHESLERLSKACGALQRANNAICPTCGGFMTEGNDKCWFCPTCVIDNNTGGDG